MRQEQQEQKQQMAACRSLPKIHLPPWKVSDLVLLGTEAYSPLTGFINRLEYRQVCEQMRLPDGMLWPLPITLAVDAETAGSLAEGRPAALCREDTGALIGKIDIREIYPCDWAWEAQHVFGTEDTAHPGVHRLAGQGPFLVGGDVVFFRGSTAVEQYDGYEEPAETRELFQQKGWKTVAAFQTRNPLHRSHEYLTKIALELCDGLLLHPVAGTVQPGDVPLGVRMDCYRAMLENYYPESRTALRLCPLEMRYAGPREALFHALVRQNYGCTHMIIGRDHAGTGHYYPPDAARRIFEKLLPGDLRIRPIHLDNAFWCVRCDSIVSDRTCPHGEGDRRSISGTALRAMLAAGEKLPDWMIRPEVADILSRYYRQDAEADA